MWRPSDRIVVGNFCSISVGVRMLGGGEHPLNMVSTYPLRTLLMRADGNNYDVKSKGPTSIGNDVWIGVDALILSGVSVGNGAVIGAGSVVTANVPPYAIVVGNPARIIGYRFSEDRIEKLLKIEWWNWSDEAIKAADAEFYSDVDEFISKYS
ncbi:MAG: CatB-related O-acetyltransferase [Candidatus Thermoplasmatota archaeon]|nr:CatB-related O-acetyltransferase [Candidatus Thermoplasmatota archaeon]